MITATRALRALLPALALAACGSAPKQPGNDAETFAARIGATPTPSPAATATPQGAAPSPSASPVAFTRGTMSDPDAAICGAPLMLPFVGKLADQPTRAAIAQALGRTENLRFVALDGVAAFAPDPASPRLLVLVDAQGIIRDARCG